MNKNRLEKRNRKEDEKMEISVKEQTLNFNIKAVETFLGVKFEGSTIQDKEKFVAEYHAKRVETTTKLMQEGYEDYIKSDSQSNLKECLKLKACTRCNTELEVEKVLDYPYYCPNCDENMYEFETITIPKE